jgi:hypothetical protein
MRHLTEKNLAGERGAQLSDCGSYRYRLWREWDTSRPTLAFLMLNPSTADHLNDDPTIVRCLSRAVASNFGRLDVANLFPLRATDPDALLTHADPLDHALRPTARSSTWSIAHRWSSAHGARIAPRRRAPQK